MDAATVADWYRVEYHSFDLLVDRQLVWIGETPVMATPIGAVSQYFIIHGPLGGTFLEIFEMQTGKAFMSKELGSLEGLADEDLQAFDNVLLSAPPLRRSPETNSPLRGMLAGFECTALQPDEPDSRIVAALIESEGWIVRVVYDPHDKQPNDATIAEWLPRAFRFVPIKHPRLLDSNLSVAQVNNVPQTEGGAWREFAEGGTC